MKKNIIKSINNINNLSKLVLIKILVLSGGGMLGLSTIGSLKYLDELNLLKNINEYYGCSIGAIISLMLCLNYTVSEIINFSINFDFSIIIENINNLIKNYTMGNSKKYIEIIKSFMINKGYDSEITLEELFKITNKKINFVVFNIKTRKEELFNYINNPNLKVWEATYMTCSLPCLFEPYLYNDNYYCDGGVVSNNPIYLIPEDKQKNTICIGLKINSVNKDMSILIENKNVINLFKYIFELFYVSFHKNKHDLYNKYMNVICIEINNLSDFLNFNISKEKKLSNIKKGYNSCKNNLFNVINYLIKNNYDKNNILL